MDEQKPYPIYHRYESSSSSNGSGSDDDDDRKILAMARDSTAASRGCLGRCCAGVASFAAFTWRPRPSGPRQRRHVFVLAMLVLATLSVCLLITADSRSLVDVDSASERLSSFWSSTTASASAPSASASASTPPSFDASHLGASEPYKLPLPPTEAVSSQVTTQLPHIPPKIWQIYLSFDIHALSPGYLLSWLARSPSHMYTVLDAAGALDLVRRLSRMLADPQQRLPVWNMDGFQVDTNGPRRKGGKTRRPKPDAAVQVAPPAPPAPDRGTLSAADFGTDALALYESMPRRVLRADFLRYLVLALEGGVYSDIDTTMVRPVHEWVPEALRNDTRLIVGLEADASPPVGGTKYEVQFCQWTLASAPNHPAMWTMVHRILDRVRAVNSGASPLADPVHHRQLSARGGRKYSDSDVLAITGPAAWTEVIYAHLNRVAGDGVGAERITWKTLTGMKEPRLFGDTLVLPINGFATGVPHSQASKINVEGTLVRHQFQGKWRGNSG